MLYYTIILKLIHFYENHFFILTKIEHMPPRNMDTLGYNKLVNMNIALKIKANIKHRLMIKKTFISSESRLRNMISFVKQHLVALNVADKEIRRVHLIAEEVLTNIISYAYSSELEDNTNNNSPWPVRAKTVTVELNINDKKELVLCFTDNGKSFNFDMFLKKSSPMTKLKIGGLGIYLINKFADSVKYARYNNKNILTVLIKNV